MKQPHKSHLEATNRILRYLSGTISFGLVYKRDVSLSLKGYIDAAWAGYFVTRRSTSGFVFSFGSAAIS